ncbi:hypothetical protein QRX50_36205 [Amycolatopsis carbonis]|uniref:Uncharacterized protein n=1 Tax=Amycolatopsis carbonis TaxID=715471 RepID=A0A9Y2IBR8_9PSEU|nr:hypothetical protein [Amycolatopsis sp. 2-15]WIX76832.1 hypothetical protein QRX50_36205 [Amycolatopsis sp. 2-15]
MADGPTLSVPSWSAATCWSPPSGPSLYGEPAVRAAITAGAHYLDSTGESQFIRQIFEHYGPGARAAGCALLTAFGYDHVPGNLAGALALRDAATAWTSPTSHPESSPSAAEHGHRPRA